MFKKEEYIDRLSEWIKTVKDFFGYDFEKEEEEYKKKRTRSIKYDETFKNHIVSAEKNLALGNLEYAMSTMYNTLCPNKEGWYQGISAYTSFVNYSDFKGEDYDQKMELVGHIRDMIHLYEEWMEVYFKPLVKEVTSHSFFQQEFDAREVDPTFLQTIDELVTKGKYKSHIYRNGDDKITQQELVYIYPNIGFGKDLRYWLQYLEQQTEYVASQEDNKIFATIFGVVDPLHPVYSYFVITLHKGKSIWVVTDQVDVDNPYQKLSRLERRGLYRDRAETVDHSELPYEIFEGLDQLRSEQTGVITSDYLKKVDFNIEQRVGEEPWFTDKEAFVVWFDKMEEEIKKEMDKAGFFKTVVQINKDRDGRKPLSIDVWKDGDPVGSWKDGVLTIYTKPEYLLKPIVDLGPNQKLFMVSLINRLREQVALGLAKEHIMIERNRRDRGFTDEMETKPTRFGFPLTGKLDKYQSSLNIGYHGNDYRSTTCMTCYDSSAWRYYRFHVRHYRQLMWLLDCERHELPRYYQNFKTFDLIPYNGNSLLDQTHPYTRLYDPCSQRHTNGIDIHLYICKNCVRKRKKEQGYEEGRVLTID